VRAVRIEKAMFRELQSLVEGQENRDDMAIPSYLHANPLINWIFWKRHDAVLGLLANRTLKRAMDFGCGTGAFLPTLASRSQETFGYDIRPAVARALVKRLQLPNCTVLGPDEYSANPPADLDVIVCADVLEHVPDLEQTCSGLRALLSKNGALIVSGPTENVLYKIGRKIAGFTGDYHVRDIDDIFATLKQQGFRRAAQSKLPLPLPDALSLFKIARFELDS
jgi:2-polyprenyl-3-methyl-5-hydroxy-6-metoxy-1,4-benzoquinol methylase